MDYLELAIEAGLTGLVLAGSWLIWVAWRAYRSMAMRGAWSARASALVLGAIAAQSLLAFPLRSQAMLCVAALAVVLLARPPIAASRAQDDI